MKFNKLVKTIDYVTYPSLQELRKINRNLGNSISKLTDLFFSAIVAVAIDKTELIQLAVKKIVVKHQIIWLQNIFNSNTPIKLDTLGTVIAILIGLAILIIIRIARWIYVRCRYKNKRKVSQREGVSSDFYKLVIPQLVTIKSLLEQHDESEPEAKHKRFLLLLQVKYEICDLVLTLDRIKVLEVKKDGTLLDNSKDVLDLIGSDAYYAVLEELTRCASTTRSYLKAYAEKADDLVNSINDTIRSSNAIQTARGQNSEYNTEYLRSFEDSGETQTSSTNQQSGIGETTHI